MRHTGETHNFRCPHCPEMFYSNSYVHQHIDEMHGTGCNVCDVCGQNFISKRYAPCTNCL